MRRYFLLGLTGMMGAELVDKDQAAQECLPWDQAAQECPPWACAECSCVRADRSISNVRLKYDDIGPGPLTSSGTSTILFVRAGFLQAICGDVTDRLFETAVVEGTDGTQHEDWLIAHGHNQVQVRGGDRSEYRYCPVCGALLYLSRDDTFLFPAPSEGVDVFGAGRHGLVITGQVLPRVLERRWPMLYVKELAVPSDALDGFGELPLRIDPVEVRARGLDSFVRNYDG